MAKMYTLAEAAEQLGLSPETLRVQARAGRIEAQKVGKTYIVSGQAIAAYRRHRLGKPGRRAKGD